MFQIGSSRSLWRARRQCLTLGRHALDLAAAQAGRCAPGDTEGSHWESECAERLAERILRAQPCPFPPGFNRINIRCDLQFRPGTKSSPVTPRFRAIFGKSPHISVVGDMTSVDPTLLRGREVSHLHPTIFARDDAEFGVLSNHADSSR